MVFFDRAAMPGDLPQTIDGLVDEVAAALCDEPTAEALAQATILLSGIAAFVARNPTMGDDELDGVLRDVEARSSAK